ncbi:MAG: thioredoxin [Actinomycetota bacterium]
MSEAAVIEVDDDNFEAEVIQSDIPVLVDFWAEWCAPCRLVAPVLEEIAGEKDGVVKVAKMNVDLNRVTAAKYEIMSIPTVIMFKKGSAVKQVVGAMPKESLIKEFGL